MATYKKYDQENPPEINVPANSGIYTIQNYFLGLEKQDDSKKFKDIFIEDINPNKPGIKTKSESWCKNIELIPVDNTALAIKLEVEENTNFEDRSCYLTFYNDDFNVLETSPKIKVIQEKALYNYAYYSVIHFNKLYDYVGPESNHIQACFSDENINITKGTIHDVFYRFKFGHLEDPQTWITDNSDFSFEGKINNKNINDLFIITYEGGQSNMFGVKLNTEDIEFTHDANSNNAKILYKNIYKLNINILIKAPRTRLYIPINNTYVNTIRDVLEHNIDAYKFILYNSATPDGFSGGTYRFINKAAVKFFESGANGQSHEINNSDIGGYLLFIINSSAICELTQSTFESITNIRIINNTATSSTEQIFNLPINNIYDDIAGGISTAPNPTVFDTGYLVTTNTLLIK